MKILFVLELYYPNIGGIEKLFKSLAEKLVEEGHSVQVITTRFRKDLPGRETINGVEIKRLKLPSRFLFTFFGLFGMLKDSRKADIIHTTSYNAAFPARIAAWLWRKKVVITFHEAWGKLWFKLPYTGWLQKRLYYSYEWLILRMKFHRYIAVSDYTAECLRKAGVSKKRISRIYNGLDYKDFGEIQAVPSTAFTFTYFGRLGISKGLDIILATLPEFFRTHPDAHFKMIIPRVPASMFRKITAGLAQIPEKNYSLLHELSFEELKHELSISSCVLIPSYSEGFCFAAAEAIAMGIPVVSSGKGALKEVVSGKYIVMQSHDNEGLAEALKKARKGEWQESPVKRFEFNETVEEYLRLYNDAGF